MSKKRKKTDWFDFITDLIFIVIMGSVSSYIVKDSFGGTEAQGYLAYLIGATMAIAISSNSKIQKLLEDRNEEVDENK